MHTHLGCISPSDLIPYFEMTVVVDELTIGSTLSPVEVRPAWIVTVVWGGGGEGG